MSTPNPRWDEATADLVADALQDELIASEPNADGDSVWYTDGTAESLAAVVLAALADAGLLLPSGTERRKQWRVRWPDDDDWLVSSWYGDRAHASALAARSRQRGGQLESRTMYTLTAVDAYEASRTDTTIKE